MLTLIDNYDSFTYNLVHFLGELGAETQVYRNDKVTVDEVLAEAVVLPGAVEPEAQEALEHLQAKVEMPSPVVESALAKPQVEASRELE